MTKLLLKLSLFLAVIGSLHAQQACAPPLIPITTAGTTTINNVTSYGFCINPATGLVTVNGSSGGSPSNVNPVGLDPTDTLDNSAIIQAAMQSLASTGGTVQLPSGFFKVSTPLVPVNGVALSGQQPVAGIFSVPGLGTPSGGTWLDCNTGYCIQATSPVVGFDMSNIGFEKGSPSAMIFGGNNIGGISYSKWRNIMVVGDQTPQLNLQAITLFNFVSLNIDNLQMAYVSEGINATNQWGVYAGGNSVWTDIFVSPYAAATATGNANACGLCITVLAPASGSISQVDYITIIRPQIIFPGTAGPGTNSGISITGVSGQPANSISIHDADIEGYMGCAFNTSYVNSSYFGFMKLTQSNTSEYAVCSANSNYNTYYSNEPDAVVQPSASSFNYYAGQWKTVFPAYMFGAMQQHTGFKFVNNQTLDVTTHQDGNGAAPTVAAGGAITTTPTIAGVDLFFTVTVPSSAVTVGTIATVTFATAYTAVRNCSVSQNGGLFAINVGHGVPSNTAMTITSSIANVTAQAYSFDVECFGQ